MNVSSAAQLAKWFQPITSDDSPNQQSTNQYSTGQQRILCTLCPRACKLKPGDKGFCFVRENQNGQMVLTTYGRSTGFCIDPIEKKPLNHFFPGTPVLSFGTAGCNLGCKFCQNWDISKSRETERLSAIASPASIAEAAVRTNCTSVAFTYNDPVIWAEYAIDTAKECRQHGIKTVAVTAGYITPNAREEFFQHFDAANVDLKAFTEEFYFSITASHLQPVLDTLVYLKRETNVWFEITNLIIPDANDSSDELRRMCDWVYDNLGPDVPLHFSAFHPDYRMLDRPRTPAETLYKAHEIAKEAGIHYPYIGNIHDARRQNTYCPNCSELLIERDWYKLGTYKITHSTCNSCNHPIPGHFQNQPGDWGPRRQPIDIQKFSSQPTTTSMTPPAMPQVVNIEAPKTSGIPNFDEKQRRALLAIAAETIIDSVTSIENEIPLLKDLYSEQLEQFSQTLIQGVFVTLHKDDALRGCCGMLGNNLILTDTLRQSANRTALHDHRFPPVTASELAELTIDVSILGPSSPVDLPAEQRSRAIELGKHGLRIRSAQQAGLLLPQVAIEQGWTVLQFLQGVCRKAGLPLDAWKSPSVTLEIFEGIAFGMPLSEFPLDRMAAKQSSEPDLLNTTQLVQLTRWLQHNFSAVQTGATPLYYASDLPDADVSGLIITVQDQATGKQFTATQLQTRPCLAMQSNLFQMISAMAQRLPHSPASQWQFGVAVLTNPHLMRSTVESDNQTFDAKREAILARNPNGFVVAWDRGQTSDSILQTIRSTEAFANQSPELIRFRCLSLQDKHAVVSFPNQSANQPTQRFENIASGATTLPTFCPRPAAIAGRFYPAEDSQRNQLVAQLIAKAKEKYSLKLQSDNERINQQRQLLAVMTPHAGLVYSGTVAAAVWSQVDIPSDVIIIGPKHTRRGVRWAVAPHDRWELSNGAHIQGNPELARLLVEHVAGLQFDAAAHEIEHAIEVQLPFLHLLAPETRVTGIAIQGGDFQEIQQAAQQLSSVIQRLPSRPLLVISSDMNHFADDQENRRRDSLALGAFQSLDGAKLLDTCQLHQISMCGALPAALVLETSKLLASQVQSYPIAYATSAETSGQTDRVVGYAAAALFGQLH